MAASTACGPTAAETVNDNRSPILAGTGLASDPAGYAFIQDGDALASSAVPIP